MERNGNRILMPDEPVRLVIMADIIPFVGAASTRFRPG